MQRIREEDRRDRHKKRDAIGVREHFKKTVQTDRRRKRKTKGDT